MNKNQILSAFSSLIGSCLEYYNYMLFMYLIPLWGKDLFADGNEVLLKGFGIVLVSALFRPIAAKFLGSIGDSIGRRRALFLGSSIMASSCLIMAILPKYSSIEFIAKYGAITAIVILCRIMQLSSVAVKLNGSAIFLMEQIHGRAGLISATMWFFTVMGMILASTVEHFCFTYSSLYPNLWRIAIGSGSIVGIIGFIIMKYLSESKEFTQSKKDKTEYNPATIWPYIAVLGIGGGIGGIFYYSTSYIPLVFQKVSNLKSIATERSVLLLIYAFSILLGGVISDQLSNKTKNNNLIFVLLCIITSLLVFISKDVYTQIASLISINNSWIYTIILSITVLCTSYAFRIKNPFAFILLMYTISAIGLYSTLNLDLQTRLSLMYIFLQLLLFCLLNIVFPNINDRNNGTRNMMKIAILFVPLYSCAALYMILLQKSLAIHSLVLCLNGIFVAPSHQIMHELFPVNKRCQSISVFFSIGTAIFGGSASFVCLYLEKIDPFMPFAFIVLCCLTGFMGVFASQKSLQKI